MVSEIKALIKTTIIISYCRHLYLFIILMLFLVGCSSQIIDNQNSRRNDSDVPTTMGRPRDRSFYEQDRHDNLAESKTIKLPFQKVDNQYDNLAESKTIKLSFKPDAGETYIQDKDIDNFFEKAKETGLILNYMILNQQNRDITFVKEKTDDVFIKVNVIVTVSNNKQIAYVFLTVSSNSKKAVESSINKFKEIYKRMLNL